MSGATIQAVIFDMDGVLTDSEPLINAAAVAMFRERGLGVQTEDFLPFIGTGEDRYLGGVAERYGFPLDLPGAKKRTYEIYLALVPTRLAAFPGAQALVHACRAAGLKLAVASSADWIKIEANLRKIGLPPELWDAIVTGEDVGSKKPAPDIFLAAARKLGLPPGACTVVEDAVNGVQAAKAAGMRCVAVAQSFMPELLQAADLVRGTIADVTLPDLSGPWANAESALPPRLPIADLATPEPEGAPGPAPGPWGFWATVGFGLLIALAFVGAQMACGVGYTIAGRILRFRFDVRHIEQNGAFLALATLFTTVTTVGLCWLFAWVRQGIKAGDYLAVRRIDRRTLLKFCLALIALGVVSDGLTWLLGRPIVPEFMVRVYATAGFPPLLWLALIVAGPIAEETFFRGFLFAGFARSPLKGGGAIVLTALLWSVIHQQYDVYGVVSIFVAGLLLGYARLRTNSLFPSIAMHALMNLIATVETVISLRFFDGKL